MQFPVLTHRKPTRSWQILLTAKLLRPSAVPKLRKLYSWAQSQPHANPSSASRRGFAFLATGITFRPHRSNSSGLGRARASSHSATRHSSFPGLNNKPGQVAELIVDAEPPSQGKLRKRL